MEIIDKSSAEQLKKIVSRIEDLDEKRDEISSQIREVLDEAKSKGFDVKTIKAIIKMRKIKLNDLQAQEDLLEIYKRALGMVKDAG